VTYERLMSLLRVHFSPEELEKLLAEGAALSQDQAVALALRN